MVLWSALERKWNWYWISVVLALLVKEDVALIVIPIGLWVALRRDVRRGLWTVVLSIATMALMFFVVMRSFTGIAFRNSWRIPFGGFSRLFRVAFRQPQELWKYLISEERPTYLFHLLAPTALAFIVAPSVALTSAAVIGANPARDIAVHRRHQTGHLIERGLVGLVAAHHLIEGRLEQGERSDGVRRIPLHDEIIKIGFLRFVETQRTAGQEWLFPALTPNRLGSRSDTIGKWFGRLRKELITDLPKLSGAKSLHSFRHTFERILRDNGVEDRMQFALGGWVDKKPRNSSADYGDGYGIKALKEAIDRVKFPGVDFSPLYVSHGLQ
jgi:hypothetical protein